MRKSRRPPSRCWRNTRLEFDRVLAPMRGLVLKQMGARPRRETIDIIAIGGHHAERGVEIVACKDEPLSAKLVGDADHDEDLGVGGLQQFAIGPGINGSPAIEVDVRA